MLYVLYYFAFKKRQENIYLLKLVNVKTKRKDARHIHNMSVQKSVVQKIIIIVNNRKISRRFIICYKTLKFLNKIKR